MLIFVHFPVWGYERWGCLSWFEEMDHLSVEREAEAKDLKSNHNIAILHAAFYRYLLSGEFITLNVTTVGSILVLPVSLELHQLVNKIQIPSFSSATSS